MSARPGGLLAVGGLLLCLSSCHDASAESSGARESLLDAVPDTVMLSRELPVFSQARAEVGRASEPVVVVPLRDRPIDRAVGDAVADPTDGVGETKPESELDVAGPAVAASEADRTDPLHRRATFAFSGDTLPHSPLWAVARDNAGGNGFDFTPMFARVAPLISSVDYAICHLETPIAPPGTALSTAPIYGVPSEITNGIASAGYDRCSTASNHTIDRGVEGIDATVNSLEAVGLSQAGMARTPAESIAGIVEVNGIAVAHLSYTMDLNGGSLPADQPWRSNIIDPVAIVAAAHDARMRGAEVVLVSLHWGVERRSEPTPFQLDVADQITRSGEIDLIVGHHAHVLQPIQVVNGRWVVFGLGNFLSNMPAGDSWPASSQDGMIVTVTITETDDGHFVVDRPQVVPTWVDRNNGFVIRPVLSDLADPTVSDTVKGQLAVSIERIRSVVGDFIVPWG